MYIMYVCLFSALSRRVGALQISIIIITYTSGPVRQLYLHFTHAIFVLVLSQFRK